ncbi:MAG: riboflavin synthase [Candidatus Micrarchaeia archaeon]
MRIGVVDTTFAKVDMGAVAVSELRKNGVKFERATVPGIKDLPVECKMLLENGCDVCIALGMPGKKEIDKQCAHEASLGIIMAQLLTNKHIVEVFVHEDEAENEEELYRICADRVRKHVQNALLLAQDKKNLIRMAGMGLRQGSEHVGPIRR